MSTNSTQNSSQKLVADDTFFQNVFLLTKNMGENILDRRVLQQAGYQDIIEENQGLNLLRELVAQANKNRKESSFPNNFAGRSSKIIVCHTQLHDMKIENFISFLHSHPLLNNTPVLVLVGEQENFIDKTVEVLRRPLSSNDISEAIQRCYGKLCAEEMKMKALKQGIYRPDLPEVFEEFEASLKSFNKIDPNMNPMQAYRKGQSCMARQDYPNALKYFTIASSRDSSVTADANYNMATLWRRSKNKAKEHICLRNAFSAYVAGEAWAKARSVAEELIPFSEKHPLLYDLEQAAKAKNSFAVCDYIKVGTGLFSAQQFAEAIAMAEDKSPFEKTLKDYGYSEILQELDIILQNNKKEKKHSKGTPVSKKEQKKSTKKEKSNKESLPENNSDSISTKNIPDEVLDKVLAAETAVWGEIKVEPLAITSQKNSFNPFGRFGIVAKCVYEQYKRNF